MLHSVVRRCSGGKVLRQLSALKEVRNFVQASDWNRNNTFSVRSDVLFDNMYQIELLS